MSFPPSGPEWTFPKKAPINCFKNVFSKHLLTNQNAAEGNNYLFVTKFPEKKKFPFLGICSKTNIWFGTRTRNKCRKKEDNVLEGYMYESIRHEYRCFINQTHIWKWSWYAFLCAENLTCIDNKQSKRNKLKQLFVCHKMTNKKKFPFLVIMSKSNICFWTWWQKREFLFFGHVVKNKYLFWAIDQKREFLFLVIVP